MQVLHLLLHELLHKPLDEMLLSFMRVDEMLIDIGDDLTDYEDDVMANSFNIYRGAFSISLMLPSWQLHRLLSFGRPAMQHRVHLTASLSPWLLPIHSIFRVPPGCKLCTADCLPKECKPVRRMLTAACAWSAATICKCLLCFRYLTEG